MGVLDGLLKVDIDVVYGDLLAGDGVHDDPTVTGSAMVCAVLVLLDAGRGVASVLLELGVDLCITVLLVAVEGSGKLLDVWDAVLARVIAALFGDAVLLLGRHAGGSLIDVDGST